MQDIWDYQEGTWTDGDDDLAGYSVEALDGEIGKIDEASNEVGAAYVVVATGPWIFGKKVLLPAGVIDVIDRNDRCVYVQRTKDEIKHAPEYDAQRFDDPELRDDLGTYYGFGGSGYYRGRREYSRPPASEFSRRS